MTNDASHVDPAGAPDWDAIARFLAGDSPAEEASRVERWLDAHPGDRTLVESLNAAVTRPAPEGLDVEAALKRVHKQMERPAGSPRLTLERGGTPRGRTIIMAGLLAAAAAFVAFANLRNEPADTANNLVTAPRTYTTRTGQRDSITLADGSRVILGPDSRLTVPGEFGAATRVVELRGDGYFDVRHNVAKPFTVRVGNAVVEDVGTTFTVESDASDATTVSVLSGSVRLRSSDSAATSGAVLGAGDRGALTVAGQVKAYPNVVVAEDTSWTVGHVAFRDASVKRIAAELKRWYGLELHAADSSMLDRHATTSFDNGEPIDNVLKRLALLLGARIERQGNSATIHAIRGSATVR
jgi:transmembrane sensor